jgi:hypothetical protein
VVSPQAGREAVGILTAERGLGVTRACGLMGISRSLYRYASCRSPALELRSRIAELAAMKRRYGYRKIHVLLGRQGCHRWPYRSHFVIGIKEPAPDRRNGASRGSAYRSQLRARTGISV